MANKYDQIKKAQAQTPEGWKFDAQHFILWEKKEVYTDSEADEKGSFYRLSLKYDAEATGEGWSRKATGRQIPTIHIDRYTPTDEKAVMFSVVWILKKTVGEPQNRRNFNALVKLAKTLDISALFAEGKEKDTGATSNYCGRPLAESDSKEKESTKDEETAQTEETKAAESMVKDDAVSVGMQFVDGAGDTYTITALNSMSVDFNDGIKSIYDFGTSRTVGAIIDALGAGAHLLTAQDAQTATETDENTTAEEPEATPESVTEGAPRFDAELIEEARNRFYCVFVDEETETGYNGSKTAADGDRVRIWLTSSEYETPTTAHNNEELRRIIEEDKATTEDYENATESAQDTQDTTTNDTDSRKEHEKEESEETPDKKEKADTSENKADNNGDIFATLAAAYLSGRTVKSKKKAVEKEKAQKTDKSTADAEKDNTGKNEAMHDTTPEFCTPDGKNGKLFCEIIRNDEKILVYATKESGSCFEVVAVSTDSDICEKQHTTTAADARRAFYEYCEMWTPSKAKENAGEITSDILTDEEIKRITKGEQVQHIQETQYGNHITAYFATPYTDKTHLVFTLSNACKEDHIAPGKSASYAGFIAGDKLYTDTLSIAKAIDIEVENRIRKTIQDELTAERSIDFESESRYSLRQLQYIAAKDYTEDARKLYYDGKDYDLRLYSRHDKYSTDTIIAYMENPENTIKSIASEYIDRHKIDIFVEYVNHNRTTAALKAIKATPEDKAHMIKAIADCVDDQKTVRIELESGETVKAEANAIKYLPHHGNISEYYIVASDRRKLPKNEYNRPDDIKPKQIKAIYHGQRTLYRATPAA